MRTSCSTATLSFAHDVFCKCALSCRAALPGCDDARFSRCLVLHRVRTCHACARSCSFWPHYAHLRGNGYIIFPDSASYHPKHDDLFAGLAPNPCVFHPASFDNLNIAVYKILPGKPFSSKKHIWNCVVLLTVMLRRLRMSRAETPELRGQICK